VYIDYFDLMIQEYICTSALFQNLRLTGKYIPMDFPASLEQARKFGIKKNLWIPRAQQRLPCMLMNPENTNRKSIGDYGLENVQSKIEYIYVCMYIYVCVCVCVCVFIP